MQIGEIEARFMGELLSAEEKFPGWPEDVIHAAAIVAEERGELLKAAIDFCFGRGTRDGLIKEATQVGAMAIRFLMHVEDYQPLEEAAEPTAMETRSKYLRKKYQIYRTYYTCLEFRSQEILRKIEGYPEILFNE